MASASGEPDFASPQSPWTRPGFVAAAVALLLIVVAALCMAFSMGDEEPKDEAGGRATPAASEAAPVPSRSLPGNQPTALPTSAPPASWQLFGQTALPYSSTVGPARSDRTGASGFARTPTGALFAAVHLSTRAGASAGRESWHPTVTRQYVPGADRDVLLNGLELEPVLPDSPGELSEVFGFRYLTYEPSKAVLEVIWNAGADVMVATVLTVVWRDGDWQMLAPPGGDWQNVTKQAKSLLGVIEWGAR